MHCMGVGSVFNRVCFDMDTYCVILTSPYFVHLHHIFWSVSSLCVFDKELTRRLLNPSFGVSHFSENISTTHECQGHVNGWG